MRRIARQPLIFALLFAASTASWALGTDAGTLITNTATLSFEIDGAAQPIVESASAITRVDERLDVATVSRDGGLVLISSPSRQGVLSFDVTNTGNGDEVFRLVVDTDVDEGGFDPELVQLYIESNGIPGLQSGNGGDLVYVGGTDDPLIGSDETIVVYVELNVPDSLPGADEGSVRLSAVAGTFVQALGVTHPDDTGFPVPGATFPGLGDRSVDVVVGLSHEPRASTVSAVGTLQVDGPIVSMHKTALAVSDGTGGSRVISGAEITYELAVQVVGTGSVGQLVLTDQLPPELAYVPGTLMLDGAELDDDFLPAGQDDAGFDHATDTVSVAIGSMAAGSGLRRVTFRAAVR